MSEFDGKVMRDFEKYLELQRSGEMNMVSPEVQKRLGLSAEEHRFIMENYAALREEYDKLKVVDVEIAKAKARVGGKEEGEKGRGFQHEDQERF